MNMRKTMKRFSALFLSMLLCLGITTMPVFAASESQDGLEVTLATNKEAYTQEEEIMVNLSVKNTNDFTVTNLSLENTIPKGYKLAEDSVATKQIGSLEAGESATLKVTYVTKSSNKLDAGDTGKENKLGTGDTGKENKLDAGDTGKENKPGKGSNKEKQPSTGDNSNIILWSVMFILVTLCVIAIGANNKKHSKKLLSLFLCLTLTGTIVIGMPSVTEAAKVQDKSISISESIKVGDSNLEINAIVKYDKISEEGSGNTKPIRPENPSEEEGYYWDNSEVIDVIDVQKSEDVLTEAEVITLLKERGFANYPITYEYSINGEYNNEAEALDTSTDKHPLYQTYYVSKSEEVFTICVINGSIIAYPASFNLESNLEAELLISESEELTSYVNEVNKFYVTIPKDSAAIVQTVKKINAETLDKLTLAEINK